MAKLVWRVKLIAELKPGIVSETEVARIERDDLAVPESLGLRSNATVRRTRQRMMRLCVNVAA
jgi:hypothetical protein